MRLRMSRSPWRSFETRTLAAIAASSAAVSRLAMRLLGGFAIIALLLAAVGIYGVMSYSVRRRTRELGTRLALGASRADIVRLVMRQAAIIAVVGLAAGTVAGLAAARALSTMLFGVPPWDPVALAARHASRINQVHCKDVRLPVMEDARGRDRSFMDSVLFENCAEATGPRR